MRSDGLGPARLWAYPVLLAGVALVFDAAKRRVPFSLLSTGLLDEVAHLATAALGLLVLACVIDAPRRFYVAALVASVAIDLDHIPVYLGLLADRVHRPVTHSLATVVVFAVAAAVSRRHRAVLAGVATGLVLHFARDIAEGSPGVRMLWPLQGKVWTASYWWFLGMIIVLTAARLVLVSTGFPPTRMRPFQTPARSCSTPPAPVHRVNSGDPSSGPGLQGPDLESGNRTRLPSRSYLGGWPGSPMRRLSQESPPASPSSRRSSARLLAEVRVLG
jgi:hypothetical protein